MHSGLPVSVNLTFLLGATADASEYNELISFGEIGDYSLQQVELDPKFQVEFIRPTNHSFYQKTKLSDLSYGIKISTDLSSILSQITRSTD